MQQVLAVGLFEAWLNEAEIKNRDWKIKAERLQFIKASINSGREITQVTAARIENKAENKNNKQGKLDIQLKIKECTARLKDYMQQHSLQRLKH